MAQSHHDRARPTGADDTPSGTDTPTGTDPDARYDVPGYEDKSFGQAVDQDRQLADRLMAETDGDEGEASSRFDEEATGAPARERQGQADR